MGSMKSVILELIAVAIPVSSQQMLPVPLQGALDWTDVESSYRLQRENWLPFIQKSEKSTMTEFKFDGSMSRIRVVDLAVQSPVLQQW